MSNFYLDTSTVVKRYIPETGHTWVQSLTEPQRGHLPFLSNITMAEVAAALAAKHRAPGGINRRKFNEPISLFINHCNTQYQLITADRPTLDLTVELTQRHRLRGCDFIQLATALINNDRLVVGGLSSLTFLAADADLLVAAQAEQLTVDNPNSHP